MGIGRNIARLRREKGMTQRELATKVNITREHLGIIEIEKKRINNRLLVQIANALNVSIEKLTKGW